MKLFAYLNVYDFLNEDFFLTLIGRFSFAQMYLSITKFWSIF